MMKDIMLGVMLDTQIDAILRRDVCPKNARHGDNIIDGFEKDICTCLDNRRQHPTPPVHSL